MINLKLVPTIATDAMYKCFLEAKTPEEKEVWRRSLVDAIPAASQFCGCNLKYEGCLLYTSRCV